MIEGQQVESALDWLAARAADAAIARAKRVYMEEFVSRVRAEKAVEFMAQGDSASAAELKAKASSEYGDALKELETAVKRDEWFRWERTRREATIEVWRSDQANQRAQAKVG